MRDVYPEKSCLANTERNEALEVCFEELETTKMNFENKNGFKISLDQLYWAFLKLGERRTSPETVSVKKKLIFINFFFY